MSPFRLIRDARDLYRGFAGLLSFEDDGEDASYEIAASTREFTRNAQAAVDDKLSFSATLMRAGEVEAANRLLKEFHDDVRDEEVALIERVNEVKAAEAVRREGMTRVRLARAMAVALIGSSVLSFSAAGMALAGLVRERAEEIANARQAARRPVDEAGTRVAAADAGRSERRLRRVHIGRVRLLLSASELRTIRALAGGAVDESRLQELIEYLPRYLAEKVENAIVAAGDTTEEVVQEVQVAEILDLKAERRRARKAEAEKAAEAEAEAETDEPTPEPSQTDDERRGLDPDPDEEPSDEGDGDEDEDEQVDSGEGGDEEEGSLPNVLDDDR